MIFLLKFGPFCRFHVGSLEICKLPQLIPLAKPNLSLHWAGSEHSSQDVWRQSQHIIIAKRSKVYMKKLELGCCDASALDIGSYTAMTLMQHRRNKPLAPTSPWSAQYLARECRKTVAVARMQRMHRMHRPQRANTWCSQRSKMVQGSDPRLPQIHPTMAPARSDSELVYTSLNRWTRCHWNCRGGAVDGCHP